MNEKVIDVINVSKKYLLTHPESKYHETNKSAENYFWALKGVSFSLNKGDVLGIIGSNGSGKTTLLKVLSQITRPYSGQITIKGKLISILDIGLGFHPDLSGKENIYTYGSVTLNMTKAEIDNKINDIIEFSELGHFIHEPVKNYSNGMYLRLALSIALFCNLDILLLDEIFSVGDNGFVFKSYNKLAQIINSSATIMIASHNMEDIVRVCNKCLWIDQGEVKLFGETNVVASQYMLENEASIKKQFLNQSIGLQSSRVWTTNDFPSNEYFQLISASIWQENAKTGSSLDYNSPTLLSVKIEKKIAASEIGLAFNITDHSGIPLLTSTHYFDPDFKESTLNRVGVIEFTCTIPKQLLNVGIYKIDLRFLINDINQSIYVKDAIMFSVNTQNETQLKILQSSNIKVTPAYMFDIIVSPSD